MKPFNLEEAKAGKPVVIKGAGQEQREIPVEIVGFDQRGAYDLILIVHDRDTDYPMFANSRDAACFYVSDVMSGSRLFMKSETKTGWINIYKGAFIFTSQIIYNTKADAISSATLQTHLELVDTIEITYKE